MKKQPTKQEDIQYFPQDDYEEQNFLLTDTPNYENDMMTEDEIIRKFHVDPKKLKKKSLNMDKETL